MDFLKITTSTINTSYRTPMSVSDLERFLLSGKIEPGFEGQVMHLIDETQLSLVEDAVKQLATKENIDTELIWKNLRRVAAEILSVNPYWNRK